MNETYKTGSQPCEKFTPRLNEVGVLDRHECPRCGKLRVFCTFCDFDHHESGWENCRPDEDDEPVAGDKVDGGDYDIVEPDSAGGAQ